MFPLNINCGSEISEAPSLTSVKVSSSSLKYVGHPTGWEAAAQPAGCSLRRWHLAVNNTISLDKTQRRRLFNLGRQTDSNSGWNQFQSSRRDFSFTGWSRLNFFNLHFPRRRNAFPQSAAGLIHVGVFLWCWLDWTGIRTGPGNSQKLVWRIFEFVFCFFLLLFFFSNWKGTQGKSDPQRRHTKAESHRTIFLWKSESFRMRILAHTERASLPLNVPQQILVSSKAGEIILSLELARRDF